MVAYAPSLRRRGLRARRPHRTAYWLPMTIADGLAARLSAAQLIRIAGADHYVMEERPSEVAETMATLLPESG